ncbi:type II secretion system protein GspH [Methylocella sp.]|uniref:type II secretion system protein GspH n=1 Tax=Methylocella sp. TaxID=1978226 RepID=UPI003784140F
MILRRDETCGEAGFTLLEVVCIVAIVALIAAVALPAMPRGASRAQFYAVATAAAALLKADRVAAMRGGETVSTVIDPIGHVIRSGSGGRVVTAPPDIAFSALLAESCGGRDAGSTISFFPSGLSCGGTISLSRLGETLEVRVAWLTGGVEIVPKKTF